LRRALVVDTPLPYPEGVAAAEVLKVGAGSREGDAENKLGLRLIIVSSLAAAFFTIVAKTKFIVDTVAAWFHVGLASTGISGGLSFALLGAGHLVGLSVGMANFAGLVIGWWILLPILTWGVPGDPAEVAERFFTSDVRFFGAGVIGVAAIWTLIKLLGPIAKGIKGAIEASGKRTGGEALPLVERDIPIGRVAAVILAMLIPIGFLLWQFLSTTPLAGSAGSLIPLALVFVLVAGIIIAAVCGYMAGLMGASNSPISGIGILAILSAALLLGLWFGNGGSDAEKQALIAYALFTTAIVFGIATISNDNLQDLKTGQLVGATPWRQQVALVYGVIFGSLVIPPILNTLAVAYGFAGQAGAGPDALSAPQAGLISAIAKGVLGGGLNWPMIGAGAAFGVVAILVDGLLGKLKWLRLPPLAIGIGIYLRMDVTVLIAVGSVLGWLYDKSAARAPNPEFVKRMGVLLATGLIVGDSLLNVGYAGIVAATNNGSPLAFAPPGMDTVAQIAGVIAFGAITWALYRYTRRLALRPLATPPASA
jgi:putative OPT family oligopeptide transporter